MKKVNLDAMILREDFSIDSGYTATNRFKQINITDLKYDSVFRHTIRKPDFQRETRDWDVNQILNFLRSIINRHFIPAVILWQNANALTFVIDGAHRISALMAWINDDYGDGQISAKFFNNQISEEQKAIAKATRTKIDKEIGPFSKYMDAIVSPQKYNEDFRRLALALSSFSFDIQWIEGDVSVAELSFFNINQKAVPISPTEIAILKGRHKANCIATRAITYAGNGNKYWNKFEENIQKQIENISKEINDLLFLPPLHTPISTLDVSIAGKNQNNLSFNFDLVNYSSNKAFNHDETDGTETLEVLKNLKKLLQILNSSEECSLGLHPMIYFYSKKGNFKPAMFYSVFLFVKLLKEQSKFDLFIKNRMQFENFLYEYDFIFDQINRSLRSSKKSSSLVATLLFDIIKSFDDGKTKNEILEELKSKFKIIIEKPEEHNEINDNSKLKSESFISSALPNALKCSICGGLMHTNSISMDHIVRKRDGGDNSITNVQITHPYCNTGFKN